MKPNNKWKKILLVGMLSSLGANVYAEITVDKSSGVLTITSDISGTVIAKVIGPDDQIVVDESYSGSSFQWTPAGSDGAYRYDVRVLPQEQNQSAKSNEMQAKDGSAATAKSDYAGGSVEVKNGVMAINEEALK